MNKLKRHARTIKTCFLRWVSRRARPHLRSYGLLQTVKIKPALVGNPGNCRVLVLAPHMDDEVIGCGGALCKHIKNGADVTVTFITNGRNGSKELSRFEGRERRVREEAVEKKRKLEAETAMQILGVKQISFWDAHEFALTITPELPDRLAALLDQLKPDLVYLPFFLEEHPDHRAVSWLLNKAASKGKFRFDCVGYEVWTPLFPNYLVEISDVIRFKTRALKAYRSQLADANYIHSALGLNAFRSAVLLNTKGYAEAFFYASLKDYLDLYKSFLVRA